MTVADAALLFAGTRAMTALLEIGEDNAAVANFAAASALRAFDGTAAVAFFTCHGLCVFASWIEFGSELFTLERVNLFGLSCMLGASTVKSSARWID